MILGSAREVKHYGFQRDDEEHRLLAAASPHLRNVIVAMLETACRPGEVLSLQWADVNLLQRDIVIRAEKAKTRRDRLVPISQRLLGVLEMRRCDPAGQQFPPDAFVFGDALGRQIRSVRRTGKPHAQPRASTIGTSRICATRPRAVTSRRACPCPPSASCSDIRA